MLRCDALDCSHELLEVCRVILRVDRDEAARDIVDMLELASEFSDEVEADWAGLHFLKCFTSVWQVG